MIQHRDHARCNAADYFRYHPRYQTVPHDEATGLKTRCGARVCGFFTSLKERFYTSFTPVGFSSNTFLHLILHQFLESLLKEKVPVAVELRALFLYFFSYFYTRRCNK